MENTMSKTIGFIGSGNMGSALIKGFLKTNCCKIKDLIISDPSPVAREKLSKEYPGIKVIDDNIEVAEKSDILFLAVKPGICLPVVKKIQEHIAGHCLVINIAAGVLLESVEEHFERPVKLIRSMPNVAALVGESMSVLCPNQLVTAEELQNAVQLFDSVGKTEVMPENLMDAVTACSGSSPAYIFMIIEAMADGAVLNGIPRHKAYNLVAQSVLGAAKMLLDTGRHPGALKDMVTSPGGTTIEALASLEQSAFRSSIIEAIRTCTAKSRKLSEVQD